MPVCIQCFLFQQSGLKVDELVFFQTEREEGRRWGWLSLFKLVLLAPCPGGNPSLIVWVTGNLILLVRGEKGPENIQRANRSGRSSLRNWGFWKKDCGDSPGPSLVEDASESPGFVTVDTKQGTGHVTPCGHTSQLSAASHTAAGCCFSPCRNRVWRWTVCSFVHFVSGISWVDGGWDLQCSLSCCTPLAPHPTFLLYLK